MGLFVADTPDYSAFSAAVSAISAVKGCWVRMEATATLSRDSVPGQFRKQLASHAVQTIIPHQPSTRKMPSTAALQFIQASSFLDLCSADYGR